MNPRNNEQNLCSPKFMKIALHERSTSDVSSSTKWTKAIVCVCADTVLCIGRMEHGPDAAERRWKGQNRETALEHLLHFTRSSVSQQESEKLPLK